MSHYHLEIIMPPTEDVETAVASLMAPFNESPPEKDDDEEYDARHAFWDFWVIGGRWAGAKTEARIGKERIQAFYAWCHEAGIKVMSLQMGKQTIATAEMRELVDAKWREMFPSTYAVCPLFDHANDQLGVRGGRDATSLDGDVARLADTPLSMECARVIIAAPSFGAGDVDDPAAWNGPLRAQYMISEDIWNGVIHVPVKWDGTLGGAVAAHNDRLKGYRDSCRIASTPGNDWLVVTVDYHS